MPMWLTKLPVWRDGGAENFDSVKFTGASGSPKCAFYLTKILRFKSFAEVYSAIEILGGSSKPHITIAVYLIVWTGHGSSLGGDKKGEIFST